MCQLEYQCQDCGGRAAGCEDFPKEIDLDVYPCFGGYDSDIDFCPYECIHAETCEREVSGHSMIKTYTFEFTINALSTETKKVKDTFVIAANSFLEANAEMEVWGRDEHHFSDCRLKGLGL